MLIKRIDIVQQMVLAGANPIHPCAAESSGVPQLLNEYYEFGTNEYISWLLHQHLLSDQLPQFIEDVVKLNIFNKSSPGMKMFNGVGRHPAHALLTCGNEDLIRKFLDKVSKVCVWSEIQYMLNIQRCPHMEGRTQPQNPCCGCERILTVKDLSQRTALQIAAQNGDFESVSTLLKFYR